MQRIFGMVAVAALAATGSVAAAVQIPADQAVQFAGRNGTVCGKVESAKYAQMAEGEPTFLHLGAAFPRHPFQVRINGADRASFEFKPEEALLGQLVCVTGRVAGKGGRAEMIVRSPKALALGIAKG